MNFSVVGRFFPFTLWLRGVWDILHHQFCLLLPDLQAYLLCKHAEMGSFFLHVLMSVWDQRYVINEIQIFKGWEEGPSDAPWSVRYSLLHHPVNHRVEEQHRHRTSLFNTGLHPLFLGTAAYISLSASLILLVLGGVCLSASASDWNLFFSWRVQVLFAPFPAPLTFIWVSCDESGSPSHPVALISSVAVSVTWVFFQNRVVSPMSGGPVGLRSQFSFS